MKSRRGLKPACASLAAVAALMVASATLRADGPSKSGATAAAPTTSTQNVNVVNTPTVNVATLPTVTIGTLPAVTLSGTPTVNVGTLPSVTIAGTPTVTIGGTAAPVPVVIDAAGAFQVMVTLNMSGSLYQNITIPDGKRLVVDYVSISGAAASTQGPIQPVVLLESALNGGGSANFYLQPIASAALPSQFYRSEQVKVYADALAVALGFAGYTPYQMGMIVALSGHLVSVP